MNTDQELLSDYAERRSESAFAELVGRHLDFIYSTALRIVRDPHLAQDVTQAVFLALGQSARQLAGHPVLCGWLHRTARNIAAQAVRTDRRRRVRETEALIMNDLLTTGTDPAWEEIAPHLDEALSEMSEPDRDALLLRYFERKSARQIAQTCGTSEEAAQKRVYRALERLRDCLARRGLAVGTGGLAMVISTNAVQAAPIGLALTISSAAAIAPTIAVPALAATKTLAMTTLQKTLVGATLAAAIGTGIYQTHQAASLRSQVQALELQHEADSKRSAKRNENERINTEAEVIKLRGEVARLRSEALKLATTRPRSSAGESDPLDSAARAWLTRVGRLRQGLQQMPDKEIPELRLLEDNDWLEAAQHFDRLDTDLEMRKALSSLRELGKKRFADLLRGALRGYAEANEGDLPSEISKLAPFFSPAVDDAVLRRYEIVQTGQLNDTSRKEPLVVETAPPVDQDFDSYFEIRMNGTSVTSIPDNTSILKDALQAFAAANSGGEPNDPVQLLPYATTPEQQAALQKLIGSRQPR